MVALEIQELGPFTSKLFVGEVFDQFLVKEVDIVTFNHFHMDGHIRRAYYSQEELEEGGISELSVWPALKPFCFSLIKGKKLPESFRVVLKAPLSMTETLLQSSGLSLTPEDINGLYLNINYENGALACITGTSVKVFTMDQSLDREWDEMVRSFLKKNEIL